MPNARGEVTTGDVRRMHELRKLNMNNAQIARVIGIAQVTVTRHIGRYHQPDHVTVAAKRRLSGLRIEARRYTSFVERAALYGCPVLSSSASV